MDTASSLIGLGLLLVFIGPILILIFNQNQKNKNKLDNLISFGKDNNLNPDITDLFENMVLGLDSKQRKLLILKTGKTPDQRILNLSEYKNSKLSMRTFQNSETRISHVSLDLLGAQKGRTTEVVFYDEDDNVSVDPEASVVLAKKWENLINLQLK